MNVGFEVRLWQYLVMFSCICNLRMLINLKIVDTAAVIYKNKRD